MRASELRRLCTLYRVAVDAVRYNRVPGKEVALADLRAKHEELWKRSNWEVTGHDIDGTFVMYVMTGLRVWLNAKTDAHQEALVDCTSAGVDTLAKWLDGELLPKNPEPASYWQKIGG